MSESNLRDDVESSNKRKRTGSLATDVENPAKKLKEKEIAPVFDNSRSNMETGAGGSGPYARGGDINAHNNVVINNYHGGVGISDYLRQELRPVFDAGLIESKACLEGTRTDTLDILSKWIDDPAGSRVFFVVGGAGLGKSAIAHRIGLKFQARGRLGSSFCFNRSYQSARNPNTLFRTIAYNLSQWNADFSEALTRIVRDRRSEINMDDISSQWNNLVIEPAKSLQSRADTVLLVIDALDESGTIDSRRQLLSFLSMRVQALPSNFRILATSRPEPDIMSIIQSRTPHICWMDLGDQKDEAACDIPAYIRHRFEEAIPQLILSDDLYDQLTSQADGLFQWAFTVCEWVLNSSMTGLTARERLRRLSKGTASDRGPLDALYSTILHQTFTFGDEDVMARFRSVMALVFSAAEPLSIRSLDQIYRLTPASTGYDEDEISLIIPPLGALLIGAGYDDVPVSPYHTSFRDFLTSSVRAQEWHVSLEDGHFSLATSCFHIMNRDLHFNMCNLSSSFYLNRNMPPPVGKEQPYTIPQPLKYACQWWMSHTDSMVGISDIALDLFKTWTEEKLLFWFEALSILGLVGKAASSLSSLEQLLKGITKELTAEWKNFQDILQDAIKFIRYFGYPIAESAPHIYISALAFAPIHSKLAQQYPSKFRNILSISKGKLRDWPAQQGVLVGHTESVCSVAFSPDGKHIVSGSSDKTVRIWDAATGKAIGEPLEGHTNWVNSVAFSPDGKHIVSGSSDKTIRIWDAATGKAIEEPLEGHTNWVNSVAFSPDGKHIVSGSSDKTVRIWDAATGKVIGGPLEGHAYSVTSVAFSADGKHIVSGSSDKTVRIWDAATGQAIGKPLEGHKSEVNSVAFSPDGKHIVSGSDDKTVRIWDAATDKAFGELLEGFTYCTSSVAFSPDGKHIVSGSSDKTVRIWDAATGKAIGEPLEGHTNWVRSVAFSPDGKHIVSGSSDKTIRIWDAATGKAIEEPLEGHTNWVNSVAFSPDGKHIVSGSSDKTVRIWDAATGQAIGEPLEGHTGEVHSVAFSPDGLHIVSGSDDKTVRIWDAATGQAIGKPLEGHKSEVNSVAFSPDGKHIVSGSDDKTVRIWDAATDKAFEEPLEGFTCWVTSVAFSPDSKHIVSGSDDKTVRIWDAATGQAIGKPLEGHKSRVISVAFSPDGQHIVSGSGDQTVRIWDAATGQAIGKPLEGFTYGTSSVAFSPDGKHIVSGSDDKTVRIWDAATGQAIGEPLEGHTGEVNSVAFSPDGKHIVSGSDDETVRIWDAATGQAIGEPLEGHTGEVQSVAFSPDGQHIVSGSSDKTVRVWEFKKSMNTCFNIKLIKLDYQSGWLSQQNSSHQRNLLLWIPPLHHIGLHLPGTIKVIGAHETVLDLSSLKCGPDWAICYTPSQDQPCESSSGTGGRSPTQQDDWLCFNNMLAEYDSPGSGVGESL